MSGFRALRQAGLKVISVRSQTDQGSDKGAHDAGFDEWILWNAAVKYKKDALLTEDEARAQQEEWDSEMSEAIETAIETTQAVEEEAETGGTDGR